VASIQAVKHALKAAARAMDQLPHDADVSSVSVDMGPGGEPRLSYRVSAPLGPGPEQATQEGHEPGGRI